MDAVVHQYLKKYGTLEGMRRDVFVDPIYYQHWTGAVKAPYEGKSQPPEIDFFLNDVHDGFMYVQQLLSSMVEKTQPVQDTEVKEKRKLDSNVQSVEHQLGDNQMKSFNDMSVDDQLLVRAVTVSQVLSPFVANSIMSGLELVPDRVTQLLPGLLEGKPSADSEEFNTAVYYLTQMMAYLGIQSIEATLNVVSFDDNGQPVRYSIEQSSLPIGELYSKWR